MILLALAMLAANPTNLKSVVNTAKPGDTITLAAGRYPQLNIAGKKWDPPITVDATLADMAGVAIGASSGITWHGGTMTGVNDAKGSPTGYGFTANHGSSAITVYGVRFKNFRLGVGFDKVNGGRITGNWLSQMSSDGIDVSLSRNIVIDRNACTDFLIKPGNHPDCIQLWSRPTVPPTADITITNNSAVGGMQGISLFNHTRDGVNDGGFDRVTIRGNSVLITVGPGISVTACRACTVRDNTVDSLPNYIHVAQLNIAGGSVYQCGNVVPRVPRQGTPPCPK